MDETVVLLRMMIDSDCPGSFAGVNRAQGLRPFDEHSDLKATNRST